MILVLDIGNTSTKCGIFPYEGESCYQLIDSFQFKTHHCPPSRDWFLPAIQNLEAHKINASSIKAMIVSCVVPSINPFVEEVGTFYFSTKPIFVHADQPMDITIEYPNRYELGTDRLVTANAVQFFYGSPAIIIDLGTATTIGVLQKEARYRGGFILPGVQTSVDSLIQKTSKLPPVPIVPFPSLTTTSTKESIQAGIFHLMVQGIDGIIRKLSSELFENEPVQVIATGGWSDYLVPHCSQIHIHDPILMLKGLCRWCHLQMGK